MNTSRKTSSLSFGLSFFVTLLTSLSIVASPFTSRAAFAANLACDNACSSYREGATVRINDPVCRANKGCRECMEAGHANGQASPYCQAYDGYKKGKSAQIIGASLYTIAAATCITACAASKTGIGSAAETACPFAGIAVSLAEMGLASKATSVNPEFLNWAQKTSQNAGGTIMGIGSMAGMTARAATKDAAKQKKAESCVSAVIFGVVAGIKVAAASTWGQPQKKVCDKILELGKESGTGSLLQTCKSKIPNPTPFKVGANDSSGGDSGDGSGGSSGPSALDPESFDWKNPTVQAAIGSGFAADQLQKMENPAKPIDGLPSLSDVMDKLEGGESPSSILAAYGAGPTLDAINDFTEKAKAGDGLGLLNKEAGAMYAAVGGARKPASKDDGMFMEFGNFDAPAAEVTVDEFKGAPKAPKLSGDYDIFHTGYPGTIFDIISTKLKDRRESVVQLEPALPLNRALAGFRNPPATRPK